MDHSNRVAIVGIGGVFSQSPTVHDFWRHIIAGRDTCREVPAGRWPLAPEKVVDSQVGQPDKAYSARGCFIDEFGFDMQGLDFEPKLLSRLDPVFRLTLVAARAAWDDSVTESLDKGRVGVIFGNLVLPTESASFLAEQLICRTLSEQVTDLPREGGLSAEPANCFVPGAPAAVVGQALNLGGGAFTLDAACASSLFALKLATAELISGRADAMLTGGVSRPDAFYTQMGFSQLRALSPTGRCAPFDARADGLIVGEGAGFFVLKRLDDALEHGDQIYATIAGIGLANDRGSNLLAPDSEGQLRAMRAAYEEAGWNPEDVDFIECHGTGTPVGDKTELASLKELWQGRPWQAGQCVIGSVKGNIGHTLTAAGAAGLLKVILALKHSTLPPTANCREALQGDESPFRIGRQALDWPRRGPTVPRRAAVSAFGFGGTNAHLLLEEWFPPQNQLGSLSVRCIRETHQCPIAIIGMDAQFGRQRGLDAVQKLSFSGDTISSGSVSIKDRWWGVEQSKWFRSRNGAPLPSVEDLIEYVAISTSEFSIPPRDLKEMLPQQLLMLQVAAGALKDGHWQRKNALRTGVIIGAALDMNTTNFHLRWMMEEYARRWIDQLGITCSREDFADWVGQLRDAVSPPLTPGRTLGALGSITASRIARVFSMGGPSFIISREETSAFSAMVAAIGMLERNELDYVLVGAVDFPGEVRTYLSAFAPEIFQAQRARGQPSRQNGRRCVEGAGAVLLQRLSDAERSKNAAYGVLTQSAIREIQGRRAALAESESGVELPNAGAASGMVAIIRAALNSAARQESANRSPMPETEVSPGRISKAITVYVGRARPQIPNPPGLRSPSGKSIQKDPRAARAVIRGFADARAAIGRAHDRYLSFSSRLTEAYSQTIKCQVQLSSSLQIARAQASHPGAPLCLPAGKLYAAPLFDRNQCLEFASGGIGQVLGVEFSEVDGHPTRVRLPSEPLMLVDRVLSIEGKPRSLTSGSIVTEHDITTGAWFLEENRAAASIVIESGQADLFLSAFLGIDFQTRGRSVYRLLDACVTFHRELPGPGETLHYEIHIERFFRQGSTYLFRFRFKATAEGRPLLTMSDGCAGFFTAEELAAGKGLLQRQPTELRAAPSMNGWFAPIPAVPERYDCHQLTALRNGNLTRCFGDAFERLTVQQPLTLPTGKLELLDRIAVLDRGGGPHETGLIRAEQDIDPQAWFLACHFIDDPVMPGTLMYECCLHTLRFFLLRMGWVVESGTARFEPVPGIATRLKCRGQVVPGVGVAGYEISLKSIGFRRSPFALANAVIFADGKPIVEITDLSLQLTGATKNDLASIWNRLG